MEKENLDEQGNNGIKPDVTTNEDLRVTLPSEEEIKSKINSGKKLSAIEFFIYSHQPSDEKEAHKFRIHLENVFKSLANAG